jgi:hypothetical protein
MWEIQIRQFRNNKSICPFRFVISLQIILIPLEWDDSSGKAIGKVINHTIHIV